MNVNRVLFCAVLAIVATMPFSTARAQGIYVDPSIDGTYMYGDTEGYGDSGCSGYSVWSNFNGNYQYGSSAYPNVYQILQSSTYVDSVNYSWDVGIDFSFPDPYSGNCSSDQLNFNITIRTTVSFYADPYAGPGGAYCIYDQMACLSGTATCGQGNGEFGVGLWFPPNCPYYAKARWLVVNGTCDVQIAYSAAGPGACT